MRYQWLIATLVMAILSLGGVACGDVQQSPRLGMYVSRLCEVFGPFADDAQSLGRTLGRNGVNAKSYGDALVKINALTAVIDDSSHAAAILRATGAPDVNNGRKLAKAVVEGFSQIEKADIFWRSRLQTGQWTWRATSRAARERLRTSLQALLIIGRQIERLPDTQERRDAMAHSSACRYLFGSVRAAQEEAN